MAFTVYEADKGRINIPGWTENTWKIEFFGFYSTDEDEVYAAFNSFIPAVFDGCLIQEYTPEHIGGGFWRVQTTYKSSVLGIQPGQGGVSPPPPPPPEPASTDPLGPEYSVNIANKTEKVFQSKETVDQGGFGSIPDTKQAIGITPDGEVQGADRISPTLEINITKQFNYVTLDYVQQLFGLVGKTNNATWFSFLEGEVLFMGATIQSKDINKVSVNFQFQASPNITGISISDELPTIALKKGWEYLWFGYKTIESNGLTIQVPRYYKIERIYDSGDFSLTGI